MVTLKLFWGISRSDLPQGCFSILTGAAVQKRCDDKQPLPPPPPLSPPPKEKKSISLGLSLFLDLSSRSLIPPTSSLFSLFFFSPSASLTTWRTTIYVRTPDLVCLCLPSPARRRFGMIIDTTHHAQRGAPASGSRARARRGARPLSTASLQCLEAQSIITTKPLIRSAIISPPTTHRHRPTLSRTCLCTTQHLSTDSPPPPPPSLSFHLRAHRLTTSTILFLERISGIFQERAEQFAYPITLLPHLWPPALPLSYCSMPPQNHSPQFPRLPT